MLLLPLLTALLVLLFFGVLAYALVKISATLESIGGRPTSYLAKLRLGLRAIEKETSHLAPNVLAINAGLKQIAGGLASVDKRLVGTIDAVMKQEA
ncbi:MAG: hypothetical protein ACOZJZ_23275 [Pseudomonadota bacterium]|jgi:hypothetical protein